MRNKINWPKFIERHTSSAKTAELRSFFKSQRFDSSLTLENASFVALDFETTGLDADSDEIVSVGLVPFDLNRIYWRDSKEWLVRPSGELNPESVVIHGITDEQLSDAPPFSEVLNQLLAELSGKIVVVHYRFIERDFLYSAVQKINGDVCMFPVIDTMSIETALLRKSWRSLLKQFFRGRGESVRLPDSRERYGLPRYQLHSAKVDALATAELLQAQINHHFPQDMLVTRLFD